MTVVKIYDMERNVVGELELPEEVFGVEVKPELLNFVVKAHLAAKRVGTASVKTRSTIRGGGKKPWRQKGTGRARVGSIRSPLWRGGAVVHGPSPRDYSFKVNKKVKKLALKMALSSKVKDEKLTVIEKIELETPKTKEFIKIKNAFELKKSLIVLPKQDRNIFLSTRNISDVKYMLDKDVNVYDLLRYDNIVVTPEVIENLKERLA